jgi:hypothetical protein
MRVRQIGAVLHVRDTPGCLWFLGLWFIAGATLCIAGAFLASNASTLAWWERLVIIGIGTGCGAAGVFVLYTTPATIARFDRGTGRGEIIVRGLRRRERTLFALDDARFVDIVESRDSDGDAMFQIRVSDSSRSVAFVQDPAVPWRYHWALRYDAGTPSANAASWTGRMGGTMRVVRAGAGFGLLMIVAVGSLSAAGAASRAGGVETLAWLTGCWQQTGARGTSEEHWTRPAGGTMLGVSRTVRKVADRDTTTEYEFARVFARDGKLVYGVLPSGQRYTEFVQTELSDSSVSFGNPSHDSPQFVRYARRGSDSVIARIDGTIQGRARAVEYKYARMSCAAQTAIR